MLRPVTRTVSVSVTDTVKFYILMPVMMDRLRARLGLGTHSVHQCKFDKHCDGDGAGKRTLRSIHTGQKRRRRRCLKIFFHLLRSFFDRFAFARRERVLKNFDANVGRWHKRKRYVVWTRFNNLLLYCNYGNHACFHGNVICNVVIIVYHYCRRCPAVPAHPSEASPCRICLKIKVG